MSYAHSITLLGLIVQSNSYQSRAANADLLGINIRDMQKRIEELESAISSSKVIEYQRGFIEGGIDSVSRYVAMIEPSKLDSAKQAGMDEAGWKCFHCGEVFTDYQQARKHFGNIPSAMPRCILIDCRCMDCPAYNHGNAEGQRCAGREFSSDAHDEETFEKGKQAGLAAAEIDKQLK